VITPDATCRADRVIALHADAEVFVELARGVRPGDDLGGAIGADGAALELVDRRPPEGAEAIVATNVLHRAVAFGPALPAFPAGAIEGRLIVNGQQRACGPAERNYEQLLRAITLGAVGERLCARDRIITGAVVQVALASGDDREAELGALGRVALRIAPLDDMTIAPLDDMTIAPLDDMTIPPLAANLGAARGPEGRHTGCLSVPSNPGWRLAPRRRRSETRRPPTPCPACGGSGRRDAAVCAELRPRGALSLHPEAGPISFVSKSAVCGATRVGPPQRSLGQAACCPGSSATDACVWRSVV
jgi:hypothetical protein